MLFFLLFIFTTPLYATQPSCQPIAAQGSPFTISTTKPILVVMHNTSMSNIFLVHSGQSSLIEPDKWSVLMLSQQHFNLVCIESRPGHEQMVPCAGKISLCKLALDGVKPDKTKWLSENSREPFIPRETT